jgi:diguanylate cyclase (GGDEF)-like protein/PAS domain S-box-containing protein
VFHIEHPLFLSNGIFGGILLNTQEVERVKKRPAKTVLLIENSTEYAHSIFNMFNNQGSYSFKLIHAKGMDDTEKALAGDSISVILLDMEMSDAQGLKTAKRLLATAPHIPLVVLAGEDGEPMALQAIEEGADDYLIKGQIEPHELMRALRNAMAHKIVEESLFIEKERATVTLNSIGDGVICTEISGNISFINPAAERMTGWLLKDASGQPMAKVFQIVDPTTRETIPNPMEKSVAQNRIGHLPLNCLLVGRSGQEIFIEDSVAPIHDRKGLITGAVIIFRDINRTRTLTGRVAHLAEHDALTGLPNRLLLNDRMGQAIALARRHKYQIALLFLDLDNFKHVNDTLGHPAGDILLQSVANRLLACVRAPDTVSRLGGDEFVVLLPEVKKSEDAAIMARRVLQTVMQPHSIDHHMLYVTGSIGVSIFPSDGLDAETLIKNADTAMYQAKENGRKDFKFFSPKMNAQALERQELVKALRKALERHEFTLQYQPLIDLQTEKVIGTEALLRWTHPTQGPIPPARFIPVAENSGLILPLGDWVLREACTQAKTWLDRGLPITTIAVNISAVQFRHERFLKGLFAILGETGLDPKYLELEVTEGVLMNRTEIVATVLHALKEQGIRTAVDDFGTGYSSLGYLRKFPLDTLKIDRAFVQQISVIHGDTAIVRAIISMGRSLNLQVIAEGVETSEDLAFLKAHKCGQAQGHYFSKSLSSVQFAKLFGMP